MTSRHRVQSDNGIVTAGVVAHRSIGEFIAAIRRLPADPPYGDPNVWYPNQKEHWLGWLREYDGPGAYDR